MTSLFGEAFNRDVVRRMTGHPQQVIGTDLFESLDGESRGQRFVRIRAGEIDCDVAVDRGLDLARLSFRGLPIHWMSPAGFRDPAMLEPNAMEPEGWGELRTWSGGMLSTFGYDHVGVPAVYEHRHGHPLVSSVRSPIHGRSSYSPTYLRRNGVFGNDVIVEGEVRQAAAFAEHLVLHRTIRAEVGGLSIRLEDSVRNDGYVSEPIQVLYNVGFGWPLFAPGTHLRMSPTQIIGMTEEAVHDNPTLTPYPERGAIERVWDRSCGSGGQWAALINENAADRGPLAAIVEWDGDELPHLLQWRITGESMFALCLEPSTTGLGGRAAEEADGHLRWVEPGESRNFSLTLRFETGPNALAFLQR